ncbi:PQQ-dependent sugar dehydrogenase, partial [Staphylococcus aureus]
MPSGGQQAGGGIAMDKNGYLFFGIGDSGTPTNSQDLTTSHGKIHRIYRDGSVPTNPFAGQAGVASTTYA